MNYTSRLIFLITMFVTACTPTAWRRVDRAALVTSTLSLACDWGQTRSAANEGWTGRFEANLIMGESPSTKVVDAYFSLALVTNIVVWAVLPPRWRSLFSGTVTLAQANAITGNVATTRGVCGL